MTLREWIENNTLSEHIWRAEAIALAEEVEAWRREWKPGRAILPKSIELAIRNTNQELGI